MPCPPPPPGRAPAVEEQVLDDLAGQPFYLLCGQLAGVPGERARQAGAQRQRRTHPAAPAAAQARPRRRHASSRAPVLHPRAAPQRHGRRCRQSRLPPQPGPGSPPTSAHLHTRDSAPSPSFFLSEVARRAMRPPAPSWLSTCSSFSARAREGSVGPVRGRGQWGRQGRRAWRLDALRPVIKQALCDQALRGPVLSDQVAVQAHDPLE
jgi:hypothetical protein